MKIIPSQSSFIALSMFIGLCLVAGFVFGQPNPGKPSMAPEGSTTPGFSGPPTNNAIKTITLPANFFEKHKPDETFKVKANNDGRVSQGFAQNAKARYIVIQWVPDPGNTTTLEIASVYVGRTIDIGLQKDFRSLALLTSQQMLNTIYGLASYQNIQTPTLAPTTSTSSTIPAF